MRPLNKPPGYQKTSETAPCEACGRRTRWFPYRNYLHDKEPEKRCLCVNCKKNPQL